MNNNYQSDNFNSTLTVKSITGEKKKFMSVKESMQKKKKTEKKFFFF